MEAERNLILSDNGTMIAAILSCVEDVRSRASTSADGVFAPLIYAAGFRHALARPDFVRLTGVLDLAPDGSREPAFFSDNIASLSGGLASLDSESVVIRRAAGKTYETVVYTLK